MLKLSIFLACFLQIASAQYYPAYPVQQIIYPPPPPIGFIPVYQNNRTYNGFNNTKNSTIDNGCLPVDFDIPGAHSLFVGCLKRNDSILYSAVIDKPSRFFSTREKIIDYPGVLPPGHTRNQRISAIRCYDLRRNSKGFARITEGGIGKTHVKLYLSGGVTNSGLFYKVQIFGQ